MVTPMHADGSIDLDSAVAVAEHLLATGHDGIVVSGTTGESATTSDDEKIMVLRAVLDAVGDRCVVIAGAGSNDTAHSVHLAKASAAAGAHALLAVTPYYNKPPQAGVVAHFTAIADATDLPVVLYDIPGRTGIPIHSATLFALADHPRIVAVKDAKGDLFAASEVMAATDLDWYSGDDALNLAHLTQGAVGVISVVGHVAGRSYAEMVAAVRAGRLTDAIATHRRLLPLVTAIMTPSQGAIMAKAALHHLGVIADPAVRLPLVTSPPAHLDALRAALDIPGVL
jgi:4-hydroxy-tetrahydrodipicolinate synthase